MPFYGATARKIQMDRQPTGDAWSASGAGLALLQGDDLEFVRASAGQDEGLPHFALPAGHAFPQFVTDGKGDADPPVFLILDRQVASERKLTLGPPLANPQQVASDLFPGNIGSTEILGPRGEEPELFIDGLPASGMEKGDHEMAQARPTEKVRACRGRRSGERIFRRRGRRPVGIDYWRSGRAGDGKVVVRQKQDRKSQREEEEAFSPWRTHGKTLTQDCSPPKRRAESIVQMLLGRVLSRCASPNDSWWSLSLK
jgi:hypothetical protein